MIIIGIDPGPTTSGLVVLGAGDPPAVVSSTPDADRATVLDTLAALKHCGDRALVAIEWLVSYGSAVGASTLDTARMVGAYEREAERAGARVVLITRPEVAYYHCQARSAKKPQVRAAVLSLYEPTGGGADGRIGTKARPGPCYGVKAHAWDALAVALAALEV